MSKKITVTPQRMPADIKQRAARRQAQRLEAWMRWDADRMEQYIDDNVTNLASAKQAIRGLARMVALMRDHIWPDLDQ